MMQKVTILLKTLGEQAGENQDISKLNQETLAVLHMLPHTQLFERFNELLKNKKLNINYISSFK